MNSLLEINLKIQKCRAEKKKKKRESDSARVHTFSPQEGRIAETSEFISKFTAFNLQSYFTVNERGPIVTFRYSVSHDDL